MIQQEDDNEEWHNAKPEYPFGRGINFQIETDAIDDLHKTIITHGYKLFLPLENKWYQQNDRLVGNRQFAIQDPDGYLLRFYQNLGTKKKKS